ncbi:ANTAR domain-containing protein [Blastococcus sp. SYSU D00813]
MSNRLEHARRAPGCPDTDGAVDGATAVSPVMVVRTERGWSVVAPEGSADVGDLLEGLSLADLLAEAAGVVPEPDRSARRAARGPATGEPGPEVDPRDARLAALERTVAQLEHALAARVATERAIGVLAERHRTTPRSAFELLRGEARRNGRPVHELAREVLAELDERPAVPLTAGAADAPTEAATAAVAPPAPRAAGGRRTRTRSGAVVPGDGRS